MGRPRIYDEPRVATAIRLPVSLRDDLQEAALIRDVSVNFLVTRAVSDYLSLLPPAERPLAERPPAERPRVERLPAERPRVERPLAERLPVERRPVERPPT